MSSNEVEGVWGVKGNEVMIQMGNVDHTVVSWDASPEGRGEEVKGKF